MKKIVIILTCVLLLTSCNKEKGTDSSSFAQNSTSEEVSVSVSNSIDEVSSNSEAKPTDEKAPEGFKPCTVPIFDESSESTVDLTITVPENWEFDNAGSFISNERAVLQIKNLMQIKNADKPFDGDIAEMFNPEEDAEFFPEGFGLIDIIDDEFNGSLRRIYVYKVPTELGVWYPHFTFYIIDDKIMQLDFYSSSENESNQIFDKVLKSCKLG